MSPALAGSLVGLSTTAPFQTLLGVPTDTPNQPAHATYLCLEQPQCPGEFLHRCNNHHWKANSKTRNPHRKCKLLTPQQWAILAIRLNLSRAIASHLTGAISKFNNNNMWNKQSRRKFIGSNVLLYWITIAFSFPNLTSKHVAHSKLIPLYTVRVVLPVLVLYLYGSIDDHYCIMNRKMRVMSALCGRKVMIGTIIVSLLLWALSTYLVWTHSHAAIAWLWDTGIVSWLALSIRYSFNIWAAQNFFTQRANE